MLDQVDSQDPALLTAPEVIQFSYSSRHNSVRAEKLFDALSLQLTNGQLSPLDFANELEVDSLQWSSFLQGNLGYWNHEAVDSHSFIIHVRPLWKKHVVPLLLRVADKFDKKAKKLELGKALWAIECYLFREGTINRIGLNELERVLSNAARLVGDPSKPEHYFVDELRANSSDTAFVDNFALFKAKGKLAFYIAWRIENHVQGPGGFDMSKISPVKQSTYQHLEHIMPRRPDASWNGIEKKDEFSDYLDRLGNHLILEGSLNASIKNGPFDKKIANPKNRDYTNSKLTLPKQVVQNAGSWASAGQWDFSSIQKRQRYLATEYAADVWEITW